MFKISQNESYFWPVEVHMATDGGKFIKQTFDAEFRRISEDRKKEISAEIIAENPTLTARALCNEVLVGWKGVEDEGSELPFSAVNLETMLNISGVESAVTSAFFDSLTGGKRKN